MKVIIGNSFNSVYYKLLVALKTNGIEATTRKGDKITELFDQQFVIRHPYECLAVRRELSMDYLRAELQFYVLGSNKLSEAVKLSSFWKNCSDDGKTINSNYGKLLFHDRNSAGFTQFEHAINCLKNNPQSKKAVLTLYDKENAYMSNDNPCTMYLKARITQNKLYLTTHMRSSDVYYGLPYDVPFFVFIQTCLVEVLIKDYPTLTVGTYTHIANSLHKYRRNEKALERAMGVEDYEVSSALRAVKALFSENRLLLSSTLERRKKDESAMEFAWEMSGKSSCLKKKVGACLKTTLPDGREKLISVGFGGTHGTICTSCAREDMTDEYFGDECPAVHSEMRCITDALKDGFTDFSKATIYVTHGPCDACLKFCNYVGIKRVVYDKPYKTNYEHWPEIEVIALSDV